jgi:tetratricopeptide (TPR) repeat protein
MKTKNATIATILLTLICIVLVMPAFADDEKYKQAMLKNIETVYKAETIEQLQDVVNTFERIGGVEKTKWEPQYYAAFGYIMMATREKDGTKKDTYLDQAIAAIEKAKTIAPAESEVIALEGFAHMIRVSVDPATRGPRYAGLAMQTFGKAVELNPENPRALALMAQMQYGTAQFFGSSTAEACGTGKKAVEKFDTFKSDNPLAPVWGKKMAEGFVAQCK